MKARLSKKAAQTTIPDTQPLMAAVLPIARCAAPPLCTSGPSLSALSSPVSALPTQLPLSYDTLFDVDDFCAEELVSGTAHQDENAELSWSVVVYDVETSGFYSKDRRKAMWQICATDDGGETTFAELIRVPGMNQGSVAWDRPAWDMFNNWRQANGFGTYDETAKPSATVRSNFLRYLKRRNTDRVLLIAHNGNALDQKFLEEWLHEEVDRDPALGNFINDQLVFADSLPLFRKVSGEKGCALSLVRFEVTNVFYA